MIHFENLNKSFGHPVLRDISLDVPAGQVLGYLGANGAGKTTTIKILTGQLKPDSGTVKVGGLDVTKQPVKVKAMIGYVPENAAVYEQLTGWEYLEFCGTLHDLPAEEIEYRSERYLDFFDLADRAHEPLATYSKGMRKKVVLTAALLHEPKVLFLDEPLDGLDANAALQLKELIRSLADDGTTVFYSSHVLEVVEKICDRIVILKDGVFAAQGTMDELRAGDSSQSLGEVFASLTSSEDLRANARRFYDSLKKS